MIEKMNLVTIIGKVDLVDTSLKNLIKSGLNNPVEAEVGLRTLRDDYGEAEKVPVGILAYDLHNLPAKAELDDVSTKLETVMRRLEIEAEIDENLLDDNFSRQNLFETVDAIYADLENINKKLADIESKQKRILDFAKIDSLDDVDFDLSRLKDLKHFDIKLGSMTYEYERRIELNYDNINALILKVGRIEDRALYLFISPRNLRAQMDSVLRSVHFKEQEILWDYMDFPAEMRRNLKAELAAMAEEEKTLRAELASYKQKHLEELYKCYTQLNMEATLDSLREKVLSDKQHYVAAFWLAANDLEKVKKQLLAGDDDLFIIAYDDEKVKGTTVPTKLFNNWLFRPFESLVNMYGTPNYKELDPTGFLAVAYMFLFGAMFGDLGQGFIFVLAGIFMSRKKGEQMIGGVLKRIGLASMFFGLIYDSIFGIEHLLSHFLINDLGLKFLNHIFIRPIENTNLILILSVLVGVVLLLISYIFGIYNRLKNGDIEEGVFGKNGINGLVLFVSMIALALLAYNNVANWIVRLVVLIIGISVLLLLVREPISHKIMGKLPLYNEGAGSYYMESGFELLETFLAMFSGGISFIRVGAFALNHVGLFVAFHTIAEMIGNRAGDITMFIIGNLIVIALEGLIVFIQGLRLVYYELFSKFYQGNGQAFVGIEIGSSLHQERER